MTRAYTYIVQKNTEADRRTFYDVPSLTEFLNEDFGMDIFTKDLLNNYFLKRNKKISRMVRDFKELRREKRICP